MSFCYAILDENNICIGVSELHSVVDKEDMIPISVFDSDRIYRKFENGQWSEEKFYTMPNEQQ